eukprot:2766453-Prymnesium_polylepis.1
MTAGIALPNVQRQDRLVISKAERFPHPLELTLELDVGAREEVQDLRNQPESPSAQPAQREPAQHRRLIGRGCKMYGKHSRAQLD